MEQRQPFFKPLEGQSTTQSENTRGAPFFAPLHKQTRSQELIQQEEHSKEKITSLHAKLYQEADKIRKWKTHTEIEIKQKDKKLNTANNTIESLRKSMLEVQLLNETLSMKFQQELEHREEICQKINATRDLCNVLKGYSAKVVARLEECEGDRTNLQNIEKDQTKQFEELSKKFQSLEVTAAENHNNLLNKVQVEQQGKKEMKESYQKTIKVTMSELDDITRQCSAKEECISKITAEMKMFEEKLGILRVEHAFMQEQYEQLKIHSADLKGSLNTKNEELNKRKEIILSLEQVVNERCTELLEVQSCKVSLEQHCAETERVYMEKLTNITTEYDRLKEQAVNDSKRFTDVHAALCRAEQTLEEMKCTKDMLLVERTEIQTNLNRCEEKEAQLTKTIFEKEDQLSELGANIAAKTTQIEQMLIIEKEVEEETERLKSDLHEALQNEKLAYEMVDELKYKFENKSDESRSNSEKLKSLQSENIVLVMKSNTLENEIKSLTDTLEKSSLKVSQTEEKLNETKHSLESIREKLKAMEEEHNLTNSKLEDEVSNVNDFKKELEVTRKEVETLEVKNKTMKADITEKNKQIKELEKETRSLKGKFTAKEKANVRFGEVHEQLQEELSKVQEEMESLQTKFDEQVEKNAELNRDVQLKYSEAKRAQEENIARRKEIEATKHLHDGEMAKMVNLLEEYKLMNQRSVEEKQKEIEEYQKNNKEQENKKNIQLANLEMETKKVKEIEKVLADKEKELLKIRETCQEQKEKLEEFDVATKALKEKERSLTKLEKELTKTKETCAKQKDHIKDLEKTAKTLKEKEKYLATREKELARSIQTCTKQEEEIATLNKQLKDIEVLKERESEVEKLRQEVESLKVASSIKPVSTPVTTEKKAGKENRSKKETKPAKKDPTPSFLKTPIRVALSPVQTNVNTPVQSNVRTPDQSKSKSAIKDQTAYFPRTPKVVPMSPIQNNVRTPVQSNIMTPVQSNVNSPIESNIRTPVQSNIKTPVQTNAKTPAPQSNVRTPSSNINTLTPSYVRTPASNIRTLVNIQDAGESLFKRRKVMFSDLPPENDKETTSNESEYSDASSSSELMELQKPILKETTNIRRTPKGKSSNRFFKTSPVYKRGMSLGRKIKSTEDTAWFDSDAIFGFDPED